jgi:hypothetical protein
MGIGWRVAWVRRGELRCWGGDGVATTLNAREIFWAIGERMIGFRWIKYQLDLKTGIWKQEFLFGFLLTKPENLLHPNVVKEHGDSPIIDLFFCFLDSQ